MKIDNDQKYLDAAIALSAESLDKAEGGPFGAVIVKNGEIIASGCNQVTSSMDPTAHAEMVAIRAAAQVLGDFNLNGCVIYSSCEPCPMCLSAIYWARLDRIVFANTRHDAASIGFDDAFLYQELNKPLEERLVPIRHIETEHAREIFRAWKRKEDRIEY